MAYTSSSSPYASTARLQLILDQNRSMAKAAGDYARMYKPANLKVFPYVRYVASVGSKNPRDTHQRYNGMIFDKRDPWLKTHWPPWDFGCKCQLENLTRQEAEEDGRIMQMSPVEIAEKADRPASGFSFNPEQAFENAGDLSRLTPVSRKRIIEDATEAVKNGRLGTCGVIVAQPETGNPLAEIPNIGTVKTAFDGMKDAAREALKGVGLDPENLPNYQKVNKKFEQKGIKSSDIPDGVLNSFPEKGIELCTINPRAAEAVDIPPCPVVLERGNDNSGISHLWIHHKDVFADPEKAVRLLRETLGDQNCRVVLQLEPFRRKGQPKCRKRLVLHNPQTGTYCVMLYNGENLRLVSWHNAKDNYGNRKWPLK